MKRRIFGLMLAMCMSAIPADAQTDEPTRAAASQAKRQAKALNPATFRPGKVERFLTWLEGDGMSRLFVPSDGFGVRIGGIESGAGFALGVVGTSGAAMDPVRTVTSVP